MTWPRALDSTNVAMLAAACALALSGCQKSAAPERVGALGAPLAVGQLTYIALETEWRDSIESSKGPRVPKNRFLLVNVTVTNTSSEQKAAPLLQIVDAKGEVHGEISEGDGRDGLDGLSAPASAPREPLRTAAVRCSTRRLQAARLERRRS